MNAFVSTSMKGQPMRRSLCAIALTAAIPVASVAGAASAAEPAASPNCFGVVSAQRATTHHDIGEHASSQEEPRLGVGNITRQLLGEDAHVGDFGAFLGVIDGDDATHCS